MNNLKRRIFLFSRALLIVLFTTMNIYQISNGLYFMAVITSFGISLMWTLNVKDISIANWTDRLCYTIGAACGTAISLYLLTPLFEQFIK